MTTVYDWMFRRIIRYLNPEDIHELTMHGLHWMHASGVGAMVRRRCRPDSRLRRTVAGVSFPSPLGVAAGLDKQGRAAAGLIDLGFGFVEVGTVTAIPQPGNPKPRLFRLMKDRAILNRMGFNNPGVKAVTRRVAALRRRQPDLVIGLNIGKSKLTPIENVAEDYARSAAIASQHADYLVVNVSSPNTPGLRSLQAIDPLREILVTVQSHAHGVPVFVKLAPDMHDDDLLAVAQLVRELNLAGIVATNTTISRAHLRTNKHRVEQMGSGGISGEPLASRSLEVLRLLRPALPKPFAIIAVGGVSTPDDVAERLEAGADLVQLYTGLIYQGPGLPHQINKQLAHDLLNNAS